MMLKEHNMLQRSMLIVTADHGECFGEHDTFFHGSNLFNETVHIPLLIRVGRGLPEIRTRLDQNREEVYSTVDFAPTILESVGIKQPETFKGISMFSLMPKPYDILTITTLGKKVAVISKKRKHIYDIETREALTFDLLTD
jgi:arylsulfatase A-like enzyme